jgi:uncharacterized secreted repeat protein (TIGR03808 family)
MASAAREAHELCRLFHPGTAALARNLNLRGSHSDPGHAMAIDRRRLLAVSALGLGATEAAAAPSPTPSPSLWARGVNAIDLRVEPDSPDDQSRTLQRAIEQTAAARVPLMLPPGVYRAANLALPAGARLVGCPGATRLLFTEGASLLSAKDADHVTLTGLVLDGGTRPLAGRGLVHFAGGRGIKIEHCEMVGSGGDGIALERTEGEVTRNTIVGVAGAAIFSLDARGLIISGNSIRDAGNNGIVVWRSQPGDDGTLVLDNRIEDIAARSGGDGPYGNAVNVFRAGNVIVRGNRIRNAAFSAVRGNAASNLQVIGSSCSDLKEVALYAEFDFQGALIASNIVDGAMVGVSVTNFNRGGRLAVVQGNLLRNLVPVRPGGSAPDDGAGVGIAVEADSAVTGNVIENAPFAGIRLGSGPYLRDLTVTGNVVRGAGIGIAVSVSAGAGAALIADNLIAEAAHGAIVGMEHRRRVTGDLARSGGERFAQLTIGANQVR